MVANREKIPKTVEGNNVEAEAAHILWRIAEWAWLVVVAGMGWFLRKILLLDNEVSQLKTSQAERHELHEQTTKMLTEHHKDLSGRLASIETHLRNGRNK